MSITCDTCQKTNRQENLMLLEITSDIKGILKDLQSVSHICYKCLRSALSLYVSSNGSKTKVKLSKKDQDLLDEMLKKDE